MANWEAERKKMWRLMFALQSQIEKLKEEIQELKNSEKFPEQSAQRV